MKKSFPVVLSSATLCLALLLTCGCQAIFHSTREVDPNEKNIMGAEYDRSDLQKMPKDVADDLLAGDWLEKETEPPVVVVLGISNETMEQLNMKQLERAIRNLMFESRKVRFVNAAKRDELFKEQQYHAKNVTAETRAKIAEQLGAKYFITGTFSDVTTEQPKEVRLRKKKEIFYRLDVEISDLTTSELIDTAKSERSREESQPLIRW